MKISLKQMTGWICLLFVLATPLTAQSVLREVSYNLGAVANDGLVPAGVAVTATFQELPDEQTLVTLAIDGGPTGAAVSHPAHIHFNDAATGGGIAYFLGPIDGTASGPGTSVFVVDEDFDTLINFDGHINVHESVSNLATVISQGNIGANASAEVVDSTLEPIAFPRTRTHTLSPIANDGLVPNGVEVTATFTELTAASTLVTLAATGGSTDTTVSHVAHIHNNDAATGGGIAYFLGPIDGSGSAPGVSYAIVEESFDFLIEFDGYINVHESAANLGTVISQGNIGVNDPDDNEFNSISIRCFVGADQFTDVANAGFIIGGSDPMTVVFRGRSTTISDNITAPKLSDPVIDVVRIGVGVVGTNDNFADAENLALLEGTSLDPAIVGMDANESLLVLQNLAPGAYSLRVRSAVEGETGLVIAEGFAVE